MSDDSIKHMSLKEIDTLFLRWYNGEKIATLFTEYGIKKMHGVSHAKHFLPVATLQKCPYCNCSFFVHRSGASSFKKSQNKFDETTLHCLNCHHDTQKSNCSCNGCTNEREKLQLAKIKEEELRLEQRHSLLEKMFSERPVINFDEMSFIQLLHLYTLCYQSTSEDVTLITPPSNANCPLTPSSDLNHEIIQTLVKFITPFCEDEKLLWIDENGVPTWKGQMVFHRIKIDQCKVDFSSNLLNELKRLVTYHFWSDDLYSLCESLLISECVDYLEYMRSQYNLPHQVGETTLGFFKTALIALRPDQIFNVIWKACKDAVALKERNGLPRLHASNTMITMMDKYIERCRANNWNINPYTEIVLNHNQHLAM